MKTTSIREERVAYCASSVNPAINHYRYYSLRTNESSLFEAKARRKRRRLRGSLLFQSFEFLPKLTQVSSGCTVDLNLCFRRKVGDGGYGNNKATCSFLWNVSLMSITSLTSDYGLFTTSFASRCSNDYPPGQSLFISRLQSI